MRKPKGEYSIQTVANAMRLFEAFQDEQELGVTQLSKRLALHKNNVFRLLATLEQLGYIDQSTDNERYRLGVRCFELGESYGRSWPLLRCARAVLEVLVAETKETVHLAAMERFEVVHLDGRAHPGMIMTGLRLGQRLPVHCTALGKVLLGCAPEEIQEAYDREVVAGAALEQRTADAIVDVHKFFEHLRTVAVRGFALDLGECEEGLYCAAAPVFDSSGGVVASLSVSGPVFRMSEDRLHEVIVPQTVAAADRLSHEMGYAS